MNLDNEADCVRKKEDLAKFARILSDHLKNNPDRWENNRVDLYLEAQSAWVDDMLGYYENRNMKFSEERPTWSTLADILLAGKVYS